MGLMMKNFNIMGVHWIIWGFFVFVFFGGEGGGVNEKTFFGGGESPKK